MTDVYLEQGRTWTFACAVDWPGWARRGKGDEAALEQLLAHADRYAAVVPGFVPGVLRVVGTVRGTGTTDFGAPDARGPWDDGPADLERLADRLEDCWAAFDRVVAGASAELRKGPRGGGRDRDEIARHVQESERSYGRSLRVAVPPRTPWPDQRAALAAAVRAGAPGSSWPVPYAVRRCAWHVLDHAWEIEDKDPVGDGPRRAT
jgi:hypothetical protein